MPAFNNNKTDLLRNIICHRVHRFTAHTPPILVFPMIVRVNTTYTLELFKQRKALWVSHPSLLTNFQSLIATHLLSLCIYSCRISNEQSHTKEPFTRFPAFNTVLRKLTWHGGVRPFSLLRMFWANYFLWLLALLVFYLRNQIN